MRKPIRVLTVLGTRPEVIKLSPIVRAMAADVRFTSILASTAQHREMIDGLFELLSIKPDYDLDIIQHDQSLSDITTRSLSLLDPILSEHRPDLVAVQGDTTSAFVGALAAFYRRIPVAHIEAGLRSHNRMHPYPEEANRRMISCLADLHFAPTVGSASNLLQEKVDPGSIFVSGNSVIDSLNYVTSLKRASLHNHLPQGALDNHRMILVTAHRRENHGDPLRNLCRALSELVQRFPDLQVVYPVHLNPNVTGTVRRCLGNQGRIHLLDPLPYPALVEAMRRAYLIITDSGGIQEEAPTFRKPVLVFRSTTERPEGLETGGVRLIGQQRREIVCQATRLLTDPTAYRRMRASFNPYGDGRAAQRIIQACLHYFGKAERPQDFVSLEPAA